MNKQYILFLLSLIIIFTHCFTQQKTATELPQNLNIQLRWIKAHPKETKEQAIIGLKWALSYLGAMLPKGSLEKALQWQANETSFTLDIGELGFNKAAEQVWNKILHVLRTSDEYKKMGGIDLGRFIILSLNSSHHYYAITGVEDDFIKFKNKYNFENKNVKDFAMRKFESCVAKGSRIIERAVSDTILELAFIAKEGNGNILTNDFTPTEFEVMDFMANGQPRFAIYDEKGRLKVASDSSITLAGKPAKCMWCHESNILKAFNAMTTVANYLPSAEFETMVNKKRQELADYQAILASDLDFSKRQEHALLEVVYISFMEPSARRLALEWAMDLEKVKALLKDFSTHKHHEFAYLGTLYHRHQIDKLSPYSVLKVPESAREHSTYEPNFYKE